MTPTTRSPSHLAQFTTTEMVVGKIDDNVDGDNWRSGVFGHRKQFFRNLAQAFSQTWIELSHLGDTLFEWLDDEYVVMWCGILFMMTIKTIILWCNII